MGRVSRSVLPACPLPGHHDGTWRKKEMRNGMRSRSVFCSRVRVWEEFRSLGIQAASSPVPGNAEPHGIPWCYTGNGQLFSWMVILQARRRDSFVPVFEAARFREVTALSELFLPSLLCTIAQCYWCRAISAPDLSCRRRFLMVPWAWQVRRRHDGAGKDSVLGVRDQSSL